MEQLPLPGHYPCLTWQLNVTLHQATGLAKFVSVLREPNDHLEIIRRFQDLEPWHATKGHLLHRVTEGVADMEYLAVIRDLR